jgi:hypothetical protein
VRVTVDLASVGLQGCHAISLRTFEFRWCGALDIGTMATPSVFGTQGGAAFWSAMFAELGVAWRPSRPIELRLEFGPGVTLASPRFYDAASASATVFQPSSVVGRGALIAEFFL